MGSIRAFIGLTFAISWSIWGALAVSGVGLDQPAGAALNVFATAGPSIAAIVLTVAAGSATRQDLVRGIRPGLLTGPWVVVAVCLPLVVACLAVAAAVGLGGAGIMLPAGLAGLVLGETLRVLLVGGPLEEELGWRGYALPRLLRDRTPLDAGLVLGLIWGIWHAPLYLVAGTGQEATAASMGLIPALGGFVGWTVGLSVLFTWLYLCTDGSLLVAIVFHTGVNVGAFLPGAIGAPGSATLLNVGLTWLVVGLIVLVGGRTLVRRQTASASASAN